MSKYYENYPQLDTEIVSELKYLVLKDLTLTDSRVAPADHGVILEFVGEEAFITRDTLDGVADFFQAHDEDVVVSAYDGALVVEILDQQAFPISHGVDDLIDESFDLSAPSLSDATESATNWLGKVVEEKMSDPHWAAEFLRALAEMNDEQTDGENLAPGCRIECGCSNELLDDNKDTEESTDDDILYDDDAHLPPYDCTPLPPYDGDNGCQCDSCIDERNR